MQITNDNYQFVKERRANCSKDLVGLAGEHFVCVNLCRLGLSTILYPHVMKKVDLSATNIKNLKKMEFQVKTLRNGLQFFLNKKKFKLKDNFYFIFIEFFDDHIKIPDLYIIPSEIVKSKGKWDANIPYININSNHKIYKNNWIPILKYLF